MSDALSEERDKLLQFHCPVKLGLQTTDLKLYDIKLQARPQQFPLYKSMATFKRWGGHNGPPKPKSTCDDIQLVAIAQ